MEKKTNYLRKELSLLNLVIIGIAGAVGTGVLFSSAGMAAVAGPVIVISWLLGGIFYLFIGLTYVQLASYYPEAGGPSRYPLYSHGRITNLINAFSDLIWYLFIPPIEALAVVEGLNYFTSNYKIVLINSNGFPTPLGAVIGVLIMLLFIPFNYYSVRFFGMSTTWFGSIKLLLYLAVLLGFLIYFFHFSNFTAYGGFAPFGFAGIFSAIPLAMFAFGGIRVIPDYAEETKDHSVLGKAIIYTVLGQTAIYVAFAIAFIAALDWKGLGISPGNWAALSNLPGNPFIDIAGTREVILLLVLTGIIGIIGPFVTGYIYQGGGMRVLFAISRSRYVSEKIQELNKYSIPLWALIVFVIVGAVVAYIAAPLPTIYGLISDSVVAGYIGFSANPVAMQALISKGKMKPMIAGSNIVSALAFIFASLIIYWSGWPSVPYAVLLLLIACIVFSVIYKVKEDLWNSIWYIAYIGFLTLMTFIGDNGALAILNFYEASAVTAIASLVFYYWGIKSSK
ncbi:APC family permease [Sulfurisphaera ohwakuensis]|uniref:Amino acid permease n=1 Tax=Sulfurisphaera ohwakuensis TaxID=69656 RepID=A0A650CIB1_SULOH|nr:APC family permease [Sulfurisphaera ohwakuensis]MBB5254956.1 amino acid transporter [Sulfurisphaera ohwakuensis]QGR17468.1 amino acid permease [Sulfurisphaera ohwakuensis]